MTVTSLEEKTYLYWRMRCLPITTGEAIALSNILIFSLNPERRLAKLTSQFQQRVIEGGRRKKPEPKDNVIHLRGDNHERSTPTQETQAQRPCGHYNNQEPIHP